MTNPQMVMYEEEFNQIQGITDRLVEFARARGEISGSVDATRRFCVGPSEETP